jgi:molybdopterin molybdotransferase
MPVPRRLRARLRGSLKRKPGREEFLRVRVDWTASPLEATLLPNQASGAVTSFAEADALAVVPRDREEVRDGDDLELIRIADV